MNILLQVDAAIFRAIDAAPKDARPEAIVLHPTTLSACEEIAKRHGIPWTPRPDGRITFMGIPVYEDSDRPESDVLVRFPGAITPYHAKVRTK